MGLPKCGLNAEVHLLISESYETDLGSLIFDGGTPEVVLRRCSDVFVFIGGVSCHGNLGL